MRALVLLLVAASALGCASTSPRGPVADASKLVHDRNGQTVTWLANPEDDAKAEQAVQEILKNDLGLDGAIQVALLRNRSLQARYEELGIAQADLVQAGLLKNPTLSGTFRFPLDPGHETGIEASLVQSFLELLTMASRKNIAHLALEGTE